MKIFKYSWLIKIVLSLLSVLLLIIIIKECKILGFCYALINLLSPLFLGFVLAWLIKPIMLYFNRFMKVGLATTLTYSLLFLFLALISYFTLPLMIREVKELADFLLNLFNRLDPRLVQNIDFSLIGTKLIVWLNGTLSDIKNIILNAFYALFIGFFFLINHQEVSLFLSKKTPPNLIERISVNLKAYVKGTIIDTLILFSMAIGVFYFLKLPYFLLFAILISLTNIIPYLGPYLGGIPSVLVAFGISFKLGFLVLLAVIILQVIESAFLHPYIMSKALKINQILIMMGLIIGGYFLGVFGMLISTPVVSIIKTVYLYHEEHPLFRWPIRDK